MNKTNVFDEPKSIHAFEYDNRVIVRQSDVIVIFEQFWI